jgi:hypothetical protein
VNDEQTYYAYFITKGPTVIVVVLVMIAGQILGVFQIQG